MLAKQSDSLDIRIWITKAEAKKIEPNPGSTWLLNTFLENGIEVVLSTYRDFTDHPPINVKITVASDQITGYDIKLNKEAYARLTAEEMISERYPAGPTSPKVLIAIDDAIGENPFDIEKFRDAIRVYQEFTGIKLSNSTLNVYIGNGIREFAKSQSYWIRLGFPNWAHAKIFYGFKSENNGYCFWVDTNDDGDENDPNCPVAENQRLKKEIEASWREEGLPVKK